MVVVEVLVFAGAGQGLEYFHAEVVDVVHVLGRFEQFPVLCGVLTGVFEDLFGFVHECFGSHADVGSGDN